MRSYGLVSGNHFYSLQFLKTKTIYFKRRNLSLDVSHLWLCQLFITSMQATEKQSYCRQRLYLCLLHFYR